MLVWSVRSTTTATGEGLNIRYNGDSGANYDIQTIQAFGTGASGFESFTGTSGNLANVTAASSPSNSPGVGSAFILDYRGTSFHKILESDVAYRIGNSRGQMGKQQFQMTWRNTSAITSIEVFLSAGGNFAAGSKITLYGLASTSVTTPTFSGCRLTRTTNQTITTGTGGQAAVSFDSEIFDTSNYHDLVTNPTRITIPTTGYYFVRAEISWNTSTSLTLRRTIIQLNGTTFLAAVDQAHTPGAGPGVSCNQSVSTLYHFTAGDYVEVLVRQESGSNLDVSTSSAHSPVFEIMQLGI
jgi:hypothetical protein